MRKVQIVGKNKIYLESVYDVIHSIYLLDTINFFTIPSLKKIKTIKWAERNGEEWDDITPYFEPRKIKIKCFAHNWTEYQIVVNTYLRRVNPRLIFADSVYLGKEGVNTEQRERDLLQITFTEPTIDMSFFVIGINLLHPSLDGFIIYELELYDANPDRWIRGTRMLNSIEKITKQICESKILINGEDIYEKYGVNVLNPNTLFFGKNRKLKKYYEIKQSDTSGASVLYNSVAESYSITLNCSIVAKTRTDAIMIYLNFINNITNSTQNTIKYNTDKVGISEKVEVLYRGNTAGEVFAKTAQLFLFKGCTIRSISEIEDCMLNFDVTILLNN